MPTKIDEPFVLFDGTYGSRVGLDWPEDHRLEVVAWSRRQGIVAEDIAWIKVFPGDQPYAEVALYDRDASGTMILSPLGDEASKYVETFPLTSLPPALVGTVTS